MTARRPQHDMTTTPTFAELGIPPVLTELLAKHGITDPFPIQAETLPDALAGRDVLGKGRTGSGKTYAFVLPLLVRLAATKPTRRPGRPRALILAPTRELVTQIDTAMAPLAKALGLRTMTVFGGVSAQRQIAGLRAGTDIVVACPGRLDDHARSGHVDLRHVEVTVLDEADHMSDLGFLPVVRRLLDQTPSDSQRLLFSATLDSDVDVLVRRYLHNPVRHDSDPLSAPEEAPTMTHHVFYVDDVDRLPILVDLTATAGRTIVFTRTKHRARALTRKLVAAGVAAVELHGNLAQNARTRNLDAFSGGAATTLVATDIAARGIHVDDVRIIIHADPPAEHKAYLHRSGRTARAGNTGTVVTLSTEAQRREVRDLTDRAGIVATGTRVSVGHPLLRQVVRGEAVSPSTKDTPAPVRTSAAAPARQSTAPMKPDGTATTVRAANRRPRRRRPRVPAESVSR